ncbi:MAG: DUF4340 domain-containing protein [Chromatiaceae bacterium]|nr:DUF4340 domain-containing protein [Chromatiaceae bacterium]
MSNKPARIDWRALLSPAVIALGALLALQLLAALVMGLRGTGLEPAGSQGSLLTFDREKVTGIRIQSSDGEPVLVTKTEGGWIIPSLRDLPAAEQKVTALLSKLAGLQKGLPVSTSEEALKRFKVAAQSFERKVTLEQGEAAPVTLYLGDSPGFRRLLVRADGDSAVFDAELGLFDVPDKADDWSDRTLLHLQPEDVQKLTVGGLTLEHKDKGWRLVDLAESEEQDEKAIDDTVRSLTNIDFVGVLNEEEKPEVDEKATAVEIEATLKSGETVRYRVSKLAEGNDYLLEVSNRPQHFTLASYAAEDLAGINRADLLTPNEESADSPSEEQQPADSPTGETVDPAAETATRPQAPVQKGDEAGSPEPKAADSAEATPVPALPEGSDTERNP